MNYEILIAVIVLIIAIVGIAMFRRKAKRNIEKNDIWKTVSKGKWPDN